MMETSKSATDWQRSREQCEPGQYLQVENPSGAVNWKLKQVGKPGSPPVTAVREYTTSYHKTW